MSNKALHFSKRANINSSAIREILKVTERPEIISFAGGLPSPKGFPTKNLQEAFERIFTNYSEVALQYGPTEGYRPLREWIVADQKRQGVEISVDEVLIVSGSQQALDLLGKLFIDEGSKVIVESPTYLGALQSFSQYAPTFEAVATDENGLVPDDLTDDKVKDARFLYAMPNFQNPTGLSMPLPSRQKLVSRCAELNLPLIEDDPYGELRFKGESLPSLLKLGREAGASVIRLGSFSKVLAPGLRLGYIIAPKEVISRITLLKQATDLHTSTISQIAVYETIHDDFFQQHLPKVRELYKQQCGYMLEAIEEHFPDTCQWTQPDGGMFIWVNLPEHVDTTILLTRSVEECHVAYVPGAPFYPNAESAVKNTLRLSFVTVTEDKIRQGIANLGTLLKSL